MEAVLLGKLGREPGFVEAADEHFEAPGPLPEQHREAEVQRVAVGAEDEDRGMGDILEEDVELAPDRGILGVSIDDIHRKGRFVGLHIEGGDGILRGSVDDHDAFEVIASLATQVLQHRLAEAPKPDQYHSVPR